MASFVSSHSWPRIGWRGPLGLAVLLGGGAVLLQLAGQLDLWQQAAAWVFLLVVSVFLARQAFTRLLGPVLAFDLVRTARRTRGVVLRAGYVLLLLVVLFFVYMSWFGADVLSGKASIMDDPVLPMNDMARFAASFFRTFLIAQYVVLLFLTPALVAGAVAEEKERGTLDDLMTTQLSSAEIILGKLVSRLGHLFLLLLAGLPVLALLQLLGGVDPVLLAAAFAYTFLSVLSMAALSMLFSVHCARVRQAVFAASCAVFGCQVYVGFPQGVVLLTLAAEGKLEDGLLGMMVITLLVHGGLTALFTGLAISGLRGRVQQSKKRLPRRLRRDELDPGLRRRRPDDGRGQRRRRRFPPIGNGSPLLWKETYVEGGVFGRSNRNELGNLMTVLGLMVIGTMALVLIFSGASSRGKGGINDSVTSFALADLLMPLLICGTLLQRALRAAGAISTEYEQRTLDSVLTTDLTNDEILKDKWRGCLGRLGPTSLGLAALLVLAGVVGVLPILGVPLVVLGSVVLGLFAINLGMYCSLVSRTSFRATVTTASVLLALGLGHWVLYPVGLVLLQLVGRPDLRHGLAVFHADGLTPSQMLTTLATLGEILDGKQPADEWGKRLLAALVGMVLYGGLAAFLWFRLRTRFGIITGRAR